jgi:hypothetical protein
LQRRILLKMLAVLIKGGCPDALNISMGQRRNEKRSDIRPTLGGSVGALGKGDQRVRLVDEDDAVLDGANLFDDLSEALLELALRLGADAQ